MRIRLRASAERDIERALRWWKLNRDKAPDALAQDLAEALDLIRVQPGLGALAHNSRLEGVRRVSLSRVRYHLYYQVRPGPEPTLIVLAFWHTSRGARVVREVAMAYRQAA